MTQDTSKSLIAIISVAAIAILIYHHANAVPPVQAQSQFPVPWMPSVSGQMPKINTPLIQFDMSSKYYKVMIDSMLANFKRTVYKVGETSGFSLQNVTSNLPINVIGTTISGARKPTSEALSASNTQKPLKVSVRDVQIEGLNNFKISSVYISKDDMKLHVNFSYRSIRLTGVCHGYDSSKLTAPSQQARHQTLKPLLEASYWNASWSASVVNMIGRDTLDPKKVSMIHSQQKLSINTKECPQALHNELSAALVERVKQTIEVRLNEVMDTVIMKTDSLFDDNHSPGSSSSAENKLRRSISKQQTTANGKKVLKRNKRQTPCQPGDELDDYVDQLFRFGTRIVRAMEPVTAPNVTIELPDYNLKIFLYEGKITRAYKFRRTKPAWVFCSNETISLGITIEVEEVRLAYKYRVISGHRLLFDGDLEAKLSPKAQAQFSQAVQEEDSEEPVQQRVDRVRVFRLGKVHVVIRGLGNLTQAVSLMINSYLNDNQEELQPTFRMVEGDAVKMINRMLANVNVPLLSVV